jgi:hypothetical protein
MPTTTASDTQPAGAPREPFPEPLRQSLLDGANHLAADGLACLEEVPAWVHFQFGADLNRLYELALGVVDYLERLPAAGARLVADGNPPEAAQAALGAELADRLAILEKEVEAVRRRLNDDGDSGRRVVALKQRAGDLLAQVRIHCPAERSARE